MEEIYRLELPKKGEIDHYFVASDLHSEKIDPASLEILIQHAKLFPKNERRLIIAGDLIDAPYLMPKKEEYKKWIKRSEGMEMFFIPEADAELEYINNLLDRFQKVFSQIIFMRGNHCERFYYFMNSDCPSEYRYHFDLESRLKLKEREILMIPYNCWLDVGALAITHGMYHAKSHNNQHYAVAGKSVMYGHVHHANSTSYITRGKTKKAWSLPAMCNLNPCYIKRRSTNWSNGYATLHVKHTGHFQVHINEIWDNQLILPHGKVLSYVK